MGNDYQPIRDQYCPGLTNQTSDLLSPPGYWQSPCGDTDPEFRGQTQRYVTILSPHHLNQSEPSIGGHWPMGAEHLEPAFRDQYIEPPTASVLGGVYLKSAPVRKWKDTDILIKIKPRFCFSPPLHGLRLSFCLLRCRHVGHTFPRSHPELLSWNKNEFRAWPQTGQWHNVPACQRIMCVDTSHKGRLTTDLCPRTKVSRLPFPTPCVIPGLQNKTETNKSNFRLDLSCLGLSTHTKSLSSSIWIQHCVLGRNYKNSLTL